MAFSYIAICHFLSPVRSLCWLNSLSFSTPARSPLKPLSSFGHKSFATTVLSDYSLFSIYFTGNITLIVVATLPLASSLQSVSFHGGLRPLLLPSSSPHLTCACDEAIPCLPGTLKRKRGVSLINWYYSGNSSKTCFMLLRYALKATRPFFVSFNMVCGFFPINSFLILT